MKKSVSKLVTALLLALAICVTGVIGNEASVDAKTKVKISNTRITLTVRQSKTLKVKGTKKKPKWSSSKKSVATVSKKGKVVAKKAGNATITAKIGKKKYKCKVTVKNKNKQQNTNTVKPSTPGKPTEDKITLEDLKVETESVNIPIDKTVKIKIYSPKTDKIKVHLNDTTKLFASLERTSEKGVYEFVASGRTLGEVKATVYLENDPSICRYINIKTVRRGLQLREDSVLKANDKLNIENPQLGQNDAFSHYDFSCTIKNTSKHNYENITIYGDLYNANGQLISSDQKLATVKNFKPNTEQDVNISGIFSSDAESYKITKISAKVTEGESLFDDIDYELITTDMDREKIVWVPNIQFYAGSMNRVKYDISSKVAPDFYLSSVTKSLKLWFEFYDKNGQLIETSYKQYFYGLKNGQVKSFTSTGWLDLEDYSDLGKIVMKVSEI